MYADWRKLSPESRSPSRARRVWWLAVALALFSAIGHGQTGRRLQQPFDAGVDGGDADSHPREMRIELGQQVVLSASEVRSYSEGTPGVVEVRLTKAGDRFVLVGKQVGVTSLLFMMLDGRETQYRIEVVDPTRAEDVDESRVVGLEDNVRLDFYFVELDRSDNFRVGVGYPDSVTTGTFVGSFDFLSQSFQAATAVVENQALLRLDIAQASGFAKLMRRAALITQNGKSATFSGGGEVNIPVQGSLTTGIHRIAFGSTIEVLPRYDRSSGRMEIALSADVSDLTDDRGSGAPGRVTSTLTTAVNLERGQAIVLAGLTAESEIKSRTGLPVLSQIPVLGYLFGTERVTKQVADNVIFIVPSVVDGAKAGDRERIDAAFRAYRKFRGEKPTLGALRKQWRSDE